MLRMKGLCSLLVLLACATVASAGGGERERRDRDPEPLVLGHRGASGYIPEHTLAGYFIAIQQGADYVEPDLVPTKDGVLVARHENDISGTTDVADHPEFAARKTTKTVDTATLTGWFTEDFTLAELKTLRAKERIPAIRPANARFDGQFEVPTLEEVLQLVQSVNEQRLRESVKEHKRFKPLGVYPETKHPSYFQRLGLPLEERLVQTLHRFGYHDRNDPVFIQSFEVANLKKLSRLTKLPIVQLIDASGKPFDFVLSGDPRTYADLVKPAGLAEIAKYADGIGPNKNLIVPRLPDNSLGTPTSLIPDAHAAGLLVHAFTFRAENSFLPKDFQVGTDPAARGNLAGEITRFLELGLDGFFTDQSDIGVRTRDAFVD